MASDGNIIIQESMLSEQEAQQVNEIINFVESSQLLPTQDAIMERILQNFTGNSINVLTSQGTPLYILLQSIAERGMEISALIKKNVSKMLYTQTNGDDLSLAAANYGFERIEAKPSSMTISILVSKNITLPANTSFTDGGGNVWVTTNEVTLQENIPTNVSVKTQNTGTINYIAPLNATNTISGLVSITPQENSIVVGREQESDTELKETIANGIPIQGSDSACARALLQLQNVNSAFVKTNAKSDPLEYLGVQIDSRQRYVSCRVSNVNISQQEADLIATTISENTIYNANFQKPADGKVKFFFGLTKDQLTQDESIGGAGLAVGQADDSIVVLDRVTLNYGNYVDVYFSLAQPTYIDVNISIQYKGSYQNDEKENIVGSIKQSIAKAVAELAQVGSQLLTSKLTSRLLTTTDLNDKVEFISVLLKKHGMRDSNQYLVANSFEYFQVYEIPSDPYAGVIVSEMSSN